MNVQIQYAIHRQDISQKRTVRLESILKRKKEEKGQVRRRVDDLSSMVRPFLSYFCNF